MTWLLLATLATAAVPADLDALVALALERDPAVLALSRDAEAARAAADAARTPMNPELMVGVDALGAPADAADPTMAMVGVEQMLQGWGQARAQAARVELDATRAESDRARVEADLRLLLAQSAVRIRAERDDAALLDEQIRQAAALREVGLRRWRSGAAPGGGGMSPGMPAGGMDEMPESAPPRVEPRKSGGGGMAGMSGGGGGGSAGMATPSGGGGVMEDTGGMPPAGGMAGGGGALAELLRIDASVATLIAERAAVDARLRGEIARLGVYVGEDAAAAVAADPEAYRLTGAGPRAPELGLAEVDRRAAAADVDAARAQLAPDVGVSIAERVMPEGMPESTNVAIALELPLWGRHRKDLAAARASEGAAEARAQAVRRDLDAALASARGAEEAAEARARVLAEVAVPRAGEAFEAARARYAAGQGSVEDVLRAWEALVAARRAHVAAARDHDLRAAERARVEGR